MVSVPTTRSQIQGSNLGLGPPTGWSDSRTRATEGGHNIVRFTSKSELRSNFFSQRVAEKWNELPLHVKNAPTVSSFKNGLRKTKNN